MNSETYRAHTVSVAISVAPEAVYIYASDPMNLPEWVPGFVKTIEQRGDAWVAESSLGPATFRFVPKNTLGVLDHQLELASGTFYSPMRVIANGTGSEVLFTVFQFPGVTDEKFKQELDSIRRDLQYLKQVLERRHGTAAP